MYTPGLAFVASMVTLAEVCVPLEMVTVEVTGVQRGATAPETATGAGEELSVQVMPRVPLKPEGEFGVSVRGCGLKGSEVLVNPWVTVTAVADGVMLKSSTVSVRELVLDLKFRSPA